MAAIPIMSEIRRRARPAVRDHRAGRLARAGRVQFAAQRQRSIRAISWRPRGSTSPPCAAPRTCFVDELIAGRGAARLPADAGAFSALLCRRQPRALRARSAHVRRPPAVLRQYPLDAGRRRARHRRARGRRCPGNLRPAHSGRRRAAAHREPVQALSPGAAPAVHPDRIAISARPCWSTAIRCRRRPARKDERPRADVVLGDRYGTSCVRVRWPRRSKRRCARSAIRSAATSPMPAASSPSITAIRPPGCTRSSSRSTARSTWTSGAIERSAAFARLAADLETLGRIGWPTSRWKSCAHIGRRPNKTQKKGPLADASGPSLGRKRPRRAAVARATALQ